MPTPPLNATPRFGPDRLTLAEVMSRRIGISFHSTQEAQFKQWVGQLKAKEKPPSTGSGQAQDRLH